MEKINAQFQASITIHHLCRTPGMTVLKYVGSLEVDAAAGEEPVHKKDKKTPCHGDFNDQLGSTRLAAVTLSVCSLSVKTTHLTSARTSHCTLLIFR